uniref:Retrotransposon gag domain-containing protein n=1 Tax=Moniliophthora roreri TaxID=221103 RepID=A0A0W0FZ42_MONRR
MTTLSTSAASDIKPKVEASDEDWATTIATSVIDVMANKKDKPGKTPLPNVYERDHKDTRHFLLDLELYFKMNPTKSNTDKKKKMLLLSLLQDDDKGERKKAAEETWTSFKRRFKTTWQPIDVAGEAQMKIEDLQMKDRADNYVHDFQLLTMETGYDDTALMKIFREGLPASLQDKLML